jgi:hypothetical protein
MDLLYSEKKPGEVPPKQLIVDLVGSLFDLYRPSGGSTPGGFQFESWPQSNNTTGIPNYSRQFSVSPDPSPPATNLSRHASQPREIPGGYSHITGFILGLLREPPSETGPVSEERQNGSKANRQSRIVAPASELPAPKVEMHDFLAAAHKPRIFQTYLKELSQACWDFFW